MRKLFVVGPNPGTGKTTTAINLAACSALAGARWLVLDADPICAIAATLDLGGHPGRGRLHDLPGILYPEVVAGLDLLSLHEDGEQPLAEVLASSLLEECYDGVMIDAPAFLREPLAGAELLVVARADSLACRMLPGFLASLPAAERVSLLLTLPAEPGGTAERELRQRLGEIVLQPAVPHDPEIGTALMFGQPLVVRVPHAPAAIAYRLLAETLNLVQPSRPRSRRLLRKTIPAVAAVAALDAGQAGTDDANEELAEPVSWDQERPALTQTPVVTAVSAAPARCWPDDAPISLLLAATGGLLLLLAESSRGGLALALGILAAALVNLLLARLFPERQPSG